MADIARIEELESEEDIEMSLYHPLEEPENFLGFKLFRLGEQTSLSGILPLLEDMGVEVVDERPHKIEPAGSQSVWIYDFGLLQEADGELQTGEVREIFQNAFARAWRGTVERRVQPPGPARPAHLAPGNGAEPTASICARPAPPSHRTTWDPLREPAHRPLLVELFEAR